MDQVKIGKFILNLRQKNNLTQKEFADRLNVTSQAVSKWENGRGIPDIEIIKKISEEFHVEIKDILEGEEKPEKKKNHKKIIGIIILISLVLIIIFYFLLRGSSNFNFSTLSSTNKEFNVEGVAAYSKDKKSIYISNIKYLNNNSSLDKYVVAECSLYEIHGNNEKKISQCGDISSNSNYSTENAHTLSYFLKDITFNVDDYSSMCKNLTSKDLYLVINAIDIDNKIVSYKIPLSLNQKCSN